MNAPTSRPLAAPLAARALACSKRAWLVASALCLLLAASAAHAPAHASEQNAVREAVSTGRYKPLAEILEIVEAQVPGRIPEVELELDRVRGPIYEVEVLDRANRKRELTIHAETGQLLELDDVPVLERKPQPLPQLLQALLARYPGYIEEAELSPQTGQQMAYEVKIITHEGQHLNIVVDAVTGQELQYVPLSQGDMQRMIPLAKLLERVLQDYPGTVLDVELEHHDKPETNPWYYDIEIRLQNGSIMELHVDVYSGAILKKKKKD